MRTAIFLLLWCGYGHALACCGWQRVFTIPGARAELERIVRGHGRCRRVLSLGGVHVFSMVAWPVEIFPVTCGIEVLGVLMLALLMLAAFG